MASFSLVGRRLRTVVLAAWLLAVVMGALRTDAATVVLQPSRDTTLIENAPNANLGGADFFNAGTAGNGGRNRALMWFDVASQVPVGALIESVTLTLDIVRQPANDWQAAVFELRRMLVSWGEGDKVPEDGSPGLGLPGTDGEATWLNRFVGGELWAAPGGEAGTDFAAQASASALVFGLGEQVFFESSPDLVADVQSWVNQPGNNQGWMFLTASEDLRKSARSFASGEHPVGGPVLTIEYAMVPEPSVAALAVVGLALGWAGARWRRGKQRSGQG